MPRSIVSKLIFTVCIVTGLGLIVFLALPFIIDRWVLPPLLGNTPFSSAQASIFRLTPHELSGGVELEYQGRTSLSVPRFTLRFTPGSLRSRNIETLELAHAVFHLYRDGDRWLLPGGTGEPAGQGPRTPDQFLLLPLGVDTVVLRRCWIVIHNRSGRELRVGISARIEPEFVEANTRRRLQSIQGSLQFFDDIDGAVSFRITADENDITAHFELENTNLHLSGDILPDALKTLEAAGLAAGLKLVLDAHTLAPRDYRLDGRFAAVRFASGRIAVEDSDGVSFALSGSDRHHAYRISSLFLKSPVPTDISIEGTASYDTPRLRTAGQIRSVLHSAVTAGSIGDALSLHYDGSWSEENGYQLALRGDYRAAQPPKAFAGASISGPENLQFSGSVSGAADQIRARIDMKSSPVTVSYKTHEIKLSPIDVSATAVRSGVEYAARLSGAVAAVELPGYSAGLEDLRFSLPFATTPSPPEEFSEGSIDAGALLLNGEKIVSISSSLHRQDMTYAITGSIGGLFNPALQVAFDGEASIPDRTGHVAWSLAPLGLVPESFPALVALPADLDFSGTLSASGTVDLNRFRVSAAVKTSLRDTSIELSDSGLSIDAVNCAVEFPELPRISSSPSQYCSTGAIDLASLHFDGSEFSFRVEDSRTIFVEKSRLNWCDGRLDSGSLRLSPDKPEIDTVLYCSRIKLGSLLEQLGFSGTEGDGSLNGTLPIRLSKNSLEFDQGFLFSTPGTGGIVRFTDSDLLRRGMGAVSETGYISYSLAALEDFTYNWTKLTFNSSGKDLLLTLELDGKPTTPLPFAFDKKGRIVESSKGKGLQYPIRLDVNFRLPLTELLQIGQSINSLMGNSQ